MNAGSNERPGSTGSGSTRGVTLSGAFRLSRCEIRFPYFCCLFPMSVAGPVAEAWARF
jgi:hypothetical protein